MVTQAGVVAMVYNGANSTLGYYRGKHDAANSVVAGALSGMLFKSTRWFEANGNLGRHCRDSGWFLGCKYLCLSTYSAY